MVKKVTNKRGPKPLNIRAENANWEDAVKHALHKPKPANGWPKEAKPKKTR